MSTAAERGEQAAWSGADQDGCGVGPDSTRRCGQPATIAASSTVLPQDGFGWLFCADHEHLTATLTWIGATRPVQG